MVPFASARNCFLRSYSGFRPFFGILFFAHNSKTAHFLDMVPILSSHFFQFPIRWPIHFFGGLNFFENFPRSSEFDAVSRIFVLGKNPLLISIFAPLLMADDTDAEMADVSNGGMRKAATQARNYDFLGAGDQFVIYGTRLRIRFLVQYDMVST